MSERRPDPAAAPVPGGAGPGPSAPPPMPIVVGVPRSGTTLLRLMLDAHPLVAVPPETYFLLPVARAYREGQVRTPDQLFAMVTATHVWDDFKLAKDAYYERLLALAPFTVPDGVRLFYRMYADRFDKPRWGDKTPRYTRMMRSIERMLPEARFVHVIRDGRDVAVSLRGTWFAPGQDVATLASDWKERIEYARKAGALCTHYLEVRYEDLVLNTRDVLLAICRFVDLPFDERMETYHRSAQERLDDLGTHYNPDGSVKVSRQSRLQIHAFSTRPPTATRIGRWRQELSLEEQQAFDRVAGDLLRELGYAT